MFHGIMAIGLLVRDLDKCAAFYRDTLKLPVQEVSPDTVSFRMNNVYFFLKEASAAADMVSEDPSRLKIDGPSSVLLAAGVEDVDAAYAELKAKGVEFLTPPTDQHWGLRTAYFADPEGHLWEINQPIAS